MERDDGDNWIGNEIQLVRILKKTPSGEVILARRNGAADLFVLKRWRHAESRWLERIERNHRSLQQVFHAGIPRIYSVRRDAADEVRIGMEYLPGRTLTRRGALSETDLLRVVRGVAAALQTVWLECGLLCCDVKPENIRLSRAGRVTLFDWHLAGYAPGKPQLLAGTPAYLSPEAFAGAELDVRSDQYSLGIALYEWIVGRRPFRQRNLTNLAEAHIAEPLPDLELVPGRLQALLLRMTAKHPDDRYSDWVEVIDALDELLESDAASMGIVESSTR